MRFKKLLATALGGLALFIGSAGSARADFIPVLTSVTPIGGPAPFTYTYTVIITQGEQAQSGTTPVSGTTFAGGLNAQADYFTIYDFDFGTSAHVLTSLPAGWASIIAPTGINPAGVSVTGSVTLGGPPPINDDPGIDNITIYRTGVTVPGLNTFVFQAQSSVGLVITDGFSSSATNNALNGSTTTSDKDQNGGGVFVPSTSGDTFPAPVPAAAGTGVALMGLMAMGRRKSTKIA